MIPLPRPVELQLAPLALVLSYYEREPDAVPSELWDIVLEALALEIRDGLDAHLGDPTATPLSQAGPSPSAHGIQKNVM